MVELKLANSDQDLKGILALQKRNLKRSLSSNEVEKEGFVTVDHDFDTLSRMQSYEPQVVVTFNDLVIGYALVMVREMRDSIPVLKSLFSMLDQLTFQGKQVSESRYYIMGQVCIDKEYRGSGLFAAMYEKHKEVFNSKYDYCITEVSESNKRSIRAHEKVGFMNLHTFSDEKDTWHIIILDLNS